MRFVYNGTCEIAPGSADRYLVRSAELGRELDATGYQVGLLRAFENPAAIDEVLKKFPFSREASSVFLTEAVDAGFLLSVDEEGRTLLPQTRRATPTIFGAPPHDPTNPAAFTVLGVPFDGNTTGFAGARFGPSAIRAAAETCRYTLDPLTLAPMGFEDLGSGRRLLQGVTLADGGDVMVTAGEPADDLYDRITRAVRDLLKSGTIPVVIGGDHSISYPVLRAFSEDSLRIIHFDAHTDLGDIPTTGLHHGNVFSFVLDRIETVVHIHQIGLRGIMGAGAVEDVERTDRIGVDRMRALFDRLPSMIPDDGPCYLSIDIDVVDPSFAPSTGTPVAGGLFPHELKNLVHAICSTHEVVGMDLVEVGHADAPDDGTAHVALETILTACDGIVRSMQMALEDERSSNQEEESR